MRLNFNAQNTWKAKNSQNSISTVTFLFLYFKGTKFQAPTGDHKDLTYNIRSTSK